jgi:hypothetical protein
MGPLLFFPTAAARASGKCRFRGAGAIPQWLTKCSRVATIEE